VLETKGDWFRLCLKECTDVWVVGLNRETLVEEVDSASSEVMMCAGGGW
jgi:hypothetical protein